MYISGPGVEVTESNVFEDEDPKTVIRARTLMRHKSNQLKGGLGPKSRASLLNQGLLMSKFAQTHFQNWDTDSVNSKNNQSNPPITTTTSASNNRKFSALLQDWTFLMNITCSSFMFPIFFKQWMTPLAQYDSRRTPKPAKFTGSPP